MDKLVNFTNQSDIELFIKDNIEIINGGINEFKSQVKDNPDCTFDETDVKNYLKDKIFQLDDDTKAKLLKEFGLVDYKKNRIEEVANKHVLYKSDLETLFDNLAFDELFAHIPTDIDSKVARIILESSTIDDKLKQYVTTTLKNISKKSLIMIRQNGFSNNIINVESGVQTANAGDSAQFLFISRAILAGFNCSNVDVRSSRYDSVIDYKGWVFKVQVKGISGTTVSFKDRDRGGKGIDTHNERNKGKRITSKDCDIYAAVDKQVGICYLIPMRSFVDKLNGDEIKSYSVIDLSQFRENWHIIEQLYQELPKLEYGSETIIEACDLFSSGKNDRK